MIWRRCMPALLAAISLLSAGCKKEAQTPPSVSVIPSDRVAPSPVGTSETILQKTFNLKGSAIFSFEIPAHAAQPHLHGIFESFVGRVHGTSDDSANIDFLILNEQQHSDFAGNRPGEALLSVEESHNQAVNFDLPASINQPAKYYLVFRTPQEKSNRVVEADFRVDF